MAALVVLMALSCGMSGAEQPSAEAGAGFNTYVQALEARLAAQRRQNAAPVVLSGPAVQTEARLRRGELVIENLTPAKDNLPGAVLYDWRGTAFQPGATAEDFERLMRDFAAYPRIYAPEIVSVKVLSQNGDRFQATMRVKQKHVITVVMDTTYDIQFGRLGVGRGWSSSRSTRIDEIDKPRREHERARAQPSRSARIPVAFKYVLDFRRTRRRALHAG